MTFIYNTKNYNSEPDAYDDILKDYKIYRDTVINSVYFKENDKEQSWREYILDVFSYHKYYEYYDTFYHHNNIYIITIFVLLSLNLNKNEIYAMTEKERITYIYLFT